MLLVNALTPLALAAAVATLGAEPLAGSIVAQHPIAYAAADTLPVPSMFPLGFQAPNVHHTGKVWLSGLAASTDTFPYGMAVANCAAGSRLDWHSHPGGQRLLVTEGKGYHQERGQPARVIRPGDVVECPPDVDHWHSGSPDTGVVYVALYAGGETEWAEPVTDEDYYSAE